nr:hypothetical protein [Tanacetum cinerariifolium]
MYASSHEDIFDMVDVDLFSVIVLNMMVVELEVFKLIEVNIEHGVTALDSYIRPPRFREIIENITDEAGSIAANKTKKLLLLLTWRESSEPTKKPICDSVTPCSLSQHDSATPCKDYVFKSITPRCIPNEVTTEEPTMEDVILEDYVSAGEDSKHEPDVDVHSFGKIMDLPFDNTCVINLVPNDVLEGEDVDVINADGFKNYPAGPSRLSGPNTRSEKTKNAGTNDVSQACSFVLNAHDKGEPCPWVLYVEKDRHIKNWLVKTHKDTYKCLQSKEIKLGTYKFLYEKIFNQVGVNPKIPVKAVQNQLQRELDVQISMSKAFRDQVFPVVGLDSNNGIYPLDHALVDAKSKSSWCWFLHCLGDDIDRHPNSNFTFISDGQKGIIPSIETMFPSAEHRYCLRHIHENIKQGCLHATAGQGGVGGTGGRGAGVASQGSSHIRWKKRRVQTKRISPAKKLPLNLYGEKLLLDKKGQNQSPAPVKAVKESCVTYGGAHSYRNCPATDGNVYRDNIQEFVSQASAVNYNQGNTIYRPQMMSNQIRPPGFPPVPNNQNV